MRTNTLLNLYMREYNTRQPPAYGWERLVWNAADLIRMATELRNTRKTRNVRKSKYIQEELF